jgi:hypothetical protein
VAEGRRQIEYVLALHLHAHGGFTLAPVGEKSLECGGLQQGAGDDVGADLGPFFQYGDVEFAAGLLRQLRQTAGGGEARRTGADDDHVEVHALAFDGGQIRQKRILELSIVESGPL